MGEILSELPVSEITLTSALSFTPAAKLCRENILAVHCNTVRLGILSACLKI